MLVLEEEKESLPKWKIEVDSTDMGFIEVYHFIPEFCWKNGNNQPQILLCDRTKKIIIPGIFIDGIPSSQIKIIQPAFPKIKSSL